MLVSARVACPRPWQGFGVSKGLVPRVTPSSLGCQPKGQRLQSAWSPCRALAVGIFCLVYFLFSVITVEISPVHCIYVGVLLISFVPFSPRPPCLPPKPQKMRRPRPLSVYNHKLFNGNMETFIKVLAV